MKTRRKTSSRVLAFLLSFIMVATTFINDYTVVRAEEDVAVSDESSSSESSDSSSDSGSDESSDEASSDDAGSSDESDVADSADGEDADDVSEGPDEDADVSDEDSDSAEGESTDETPEEGETDVDEDGAEDEDLEEKEEEIPLEDLVIDEDQIVITFRASEGGSVSMPYQVLGEEDDVASVMAIADDGYEFDNWTKDGEEVSTDEEFTPAKEDAEYVAHFVAVEEEEYPVFDESVEIDGVTITVTADEGIIPKGTEISAKKIDVSASAKRNVIEASSLETVDDSISFDIELIYEGKKLEWDNGTVSVTFSGDKVDELIQKHENVCMVHFEEDSRTVADITDVESSKDVELDVEHFTGVSLFGGGEQYYTTCTLTEFKSNGVQITDNSLIYSTNWSVDRNNQAKLENKTSKTVTVKGKNNAQPGEYTITHQGYFLSNTIKILVTADVSATTEVNFYVLLPTSTIGATKEQDYYPNTNYGGHVALRGTVAKTEAYSNLAGLPEEYNVTLYDDAKTKLEGYFKSVEAYKNAELTWENVIWNSISYQKDGYSTTEKVDNGKDQGHYHVDGYVKNYGVHVTYKSNYPAEAGNGPSDTFESETTGNTYDVKDYSEIFTQNPAGYKFLGWSTTSNGEVKYNKDSEIKIISNVDLYAQWERVPTITFTYTAEEGGKNLSRISDTVNANDGSGINGDVTVETEEGYTFTGWYNGEKRVSEDTTLTVDEIKEGANKSAGLYTATSFIAKFEKTKYTVTYNLNASSVDLKNGDIKGVNVTGFTLVGDADKGIYQKTPLHYGDNLPTIGTPSIDENDQYKYEFTGWLSSVDGNVYGTSTLPLPTTVTGDVTYTAQWSRTDKEYNVTVYVTPNGMATYSVYENSGLNKWIFGSKVIVSIDSITEGYELDTVIVDDNDAVYSKAGNTNNLQGQNKNQIIFDNLSANHAVAINLKKKNYEVTYDANTGYFDNATTKVTETETVEHGSNVKNVPTVVGKDQDAEYTYEFAGWSTTKQTVSDMQAGIKPETVYDEDGLKKISITGNTVFYAVYKASVRLYTVTFMTGTGENGEKIAEVKVPYDSTIENTKGAVMPSHDTVQAYAVVAGANKHFADKWTTESDGEFKATTKVTSDITVYANWYDWFKVTYDVNGGSWATDENNNETPVTDIKEYDNGTTVTVEFAPAPTKLGYTFAGWATSSDATEAEYKDGLFGKDSFEITQDTTLYAVYTPATSKYRVLVYTQTGDWSNGTLTDRYELDQELTPTTAFEATTDTVVTADSVVQELKLSDTEYKYNSGKSNASITVKPSAESAELENLPTIRIFYDLVPYTVTLKLDGGSLHGFDDVLTTYKNAKVDFSTVSTEGEKAPVYSLKYTCKSSEFTVPYASKPGYQFRNWKDDALEGIPDWIPFGQESMQFTVDPDETLADKSYTALWKADRDGVGLYVLYPDQTKPVETTSKEKTVNYSTKNYTDKLGVATVNADVIDTYYTYAEDVEGNNVEAQIQSSPTYTIQSNNTYFKVIDDEKYLCIDNYNHYNWKVKVSDINWYVIKSTQNDKSSWNIDGIGENWEKEPVNYTVTYNANFGKVGDVEYTGEVNGIKQAGNYEVSTTVAYDSPIPAAPSVKKYAGSRYNYKLLGWSVHQIETKEAGEFTTEELASIQRAEDIAAQKVSGDVTYYAVWQANWNPYTVTYDLAGGTLNSSEENVVFSDARYGYKLYDSTNTAKDYYPEGTPTRETSEGYTYTFAGWKLGETVYADENALASVTVSGNMTLTAQWNSYVTVTYQSWKNEIGESSRMNLGSETLKVKPSVATAGGKKAPEYTGYTFKGWYLGESTEPITNADGTVKATLTNDDIQNAIAKGDGEYQNVTFTAKYNNNTLGLENFTMTKVYNGSDQHYDILAEINNNGYAKVNGNACTISGTELTAYQYENDERKGASINPYIGKVTGESGWKYDLVLSKPGYEPVEAVVTMIQTPRPIVITANGGTYTYDGTEHFAEVNKMDGSAVAGKQFTVSGDDTVESGLVNGQNISATVTGSATTVAQSPATTSVVENSVKITDKDNKKDVTGNYAITYNTGEIIINGRSLKMTITAESDSKMYDGTPLQNTASSVVYGDGISLAPGHKLLVTVDGSATNVKDTKTGNNKITNWRIVDVTDTDVTANYSYGADDVVLHNGTLTINARNLTLTANSGQWPWDGKKHETPVGDDGKQYTMTGDGLAGGEEITVKVKGSQKEIGSSASVIDKVTIKSGSKKTTDNYEITCVGGKLEVLRQTAVPLTIRIKSSDKIYDGTALIPNASDNKVTYTKDSMIDGDKVEVVALTADADPDTEGIQDLVNIGTAPIVLDYKIVDKNGNEVPEGSYAVTIEPGAQVEIRPRDFTVRVDDSSDPYDGKPHISGTYTIKKGELADGDSIDASYKGAKIIPGKYVKAAEFDSFVIKNAKNENVTANYNLHTEAGTIEITRNNELVLTMTANSDSWVYDGESHSLEGTGSVSTNGFTVKGAVDGDTVVAEVTGSITNKGTEASKITANSIKVYRGDDDVTAGYVLPSYEAGTLKDGELEVTARPIVLKAADVSKVYDGFEFTLEDVAGDTFTTAYGTAESVDAEKEPFVLKASIDTASTVWSVDDLATILSSSDNIGKTEIKPVESGIKIFADGTDVTENYSVEYLPGTATITIGDDLIPATLTSNSATYTYTGAEFSVDGYVAEVGEAYKADAEELQYVVLVEKGDEVAFVPVKAGVSATAVGTYEAVFYYEVETMALAEATQEETTVTERIEVSADDIHILAGNTDVTEFFTLTVENGTLTINAAPAQGGGGGGRRAAAATQTGDVLGAKREDEALVEEGEVLGATRAPKTSDSAKAILWMLVMGGSALGAAAILAQRKKEEQQ